MIGVQIGEALIGGRGKKPVVVGLRRTSEGFLTETFAICASVLMGTVIAGTERESSKAGLEDLRS